MGRVVYMDGQFIPEAEAKISIYDLSCMQAAAAFEMCRSFHGRHFKLREHLKRLIDSCCLLNLPMPYELEHSLADLEALCERVSAANDHGPGEEHRLLIVVSPGCAPMYRELEGVIPHPFLYIADFPLRYTVQGFGKYFTEGVHCVTSPIEQVPDACVPSRAKHRSRLHFHLAQQQASEGTWPILLQGDAVTEAPGANIMIVYGHQVIYTKRNILQGISLNTAVTLSEAHEIGFFHKNNLEEIDELWLTGTPFCALPVVSLDGRPIGDGQIGPRYKEVMAKWNDLVGLDIAAQIQEWDAVGARTTEY